MLRPNAQSNKSFVLGLAVVLGVVIALMYLGFEWVVNQGTQLLWISLGQTDEHRWRVIPLAIVLGVVYSLILRRLGTVRLVPVETNLADEIQGHGGLVKVREVIGLLAIGVVSLVAGAALGPEAPLVAASIALTAWISQKVHLQDTPQAKLLAITSLGALLCAFLHTLVPMLIPLMILLKKKQLKFVTTLVVLLACVVSWVVVGLLKGFSLARYPLPTDFNLISVLMAALIGFLTVLLAALLKKMLSGVFTQAKKLEGKVHWVVTASIFGGVLGLLYVIGSPSVQFSGEEGIKTLIDNREQFSAFIFAFLLVGKMLVSSWSLATGYRGGLVFPSIYMATALSFAACTFFGLSGTTEVGATIGGASGILLSMTSPIVGIVLVFSLFPIKLVMVTAAGAVGAVLGGKVFEKLLAKPAGA